MKGLWSALAFAVWQAACTASGAETFRRLNGPEIKARFGGMELSDEVHWGLVFGASGRLTAVENGTKSGAAGAWRVAGDELCLALGQEQVRCHQVWVSGRYVRLMRDGESSLGGVLQRPRTGKGAL